MGSDAMGSDQSHDLGGQPAVTASALAAGFLGSSRLDGGWFELGGSSIDAARLVSALDQRLGLRVSLRELLETPSVAELLADRRGTDVGGRGGGSGSDRVDRFWGELSRLPAHRRLAVAQFLLGVAATGGGRGPHGADLSTL